MKDNTIYWIIGIAIFLLIVANYQPKEIVGLKLHYYKDGVEVYPFSGFSIVTGTFDEISFAIYGSETQGTPIDDLKITDASPQAFKDSLPTTSQSLNPYETNKVLWVSDRIPTQQFESLPQPVNFVVHVTGAGETKQSSVKLTFVPKFFTLFFDEFEDGEIDNNLWYDHTTTCAYQHQSPPSATISEVLAEDGYDLLHTYRSTGAGDITQTWTRLMTKYDFNDGRDYDIDFTLTSPGFTKRGPVASGEMEEIALIVTNDISVPSFGWSCQDVCYVENRNFDLIYSFEGDDLLSLKSPISDWKIQVRGNEFSLYDHNENWVSSTTTSRDKWFVGFIVHNGGGGSCVKTVDASIYNFTVETR